MCFSGVVAHIHLSNGDSGEGTKNLRFLEPNFGWGGLGCKLSRPLLKLGTPQTRLLNGAPGPTKKINLGMPCTSAKLLKFHGLAIKWAIFLLKASNAEEKQKFRSM